MNHIRELLASESLTELNLYDLVMSLRKQRASMVQTQVHFSSDQRYFSVQDQYQFVHKCVARYARRKLGIPDPHMESPPPFRVSLEFSSRNLFFQENEAKEAKLIDFSSDESDNETTAVPDFPGWFFPLCSYLLLFSEEPRSRPQGPEELGSAAAS